MQTNPLNSSKTPGIIVSEIAMMSSGFRGVHFLVEGDDDSQFWKPRILRASVNIVSCEGKPNLVGAASMALGQGLNSVGGVYDADFDRHFGLVYSAAHLAVTDQNDLETTFLASSALEIVLHEYADVNLIDTFESSSGQTVADRLQAIATQFGLLRYLNHIEQHGVNFDRLSPYRFVSQDKWELDSAGLRNEYASLCGIAESTLSAEISSKCPQPAGWSLCQGHDCVRILAQGLKNAIGHRQISEQDLTRILRIAFSDALLIQTNMFITLKSIEARVGIPMFSA